jgi:zinc transport system permease protein
MFDFLNYEFIQNAIISGVLVSVVSGLVGSLIVVNRMVFLAGGVAHTAYGGIGLALYFSMPMFLGASIFAVSSALLIAFLTLNKRENIDTIIGLVWAVGMAIGIIFVDLTPGYNVDLMSYLFGSILAVSNSDIVFMSILLVSILLILFVWYRDILAVSYDSEYASIRGINVKFFYTLMLIMSALTIVVAIKVVGLILVIALFTIPVYIAQKIANSLAVMMFLSALFSTFFTLLGLFFSYQYNLTSGATIILVSAFVFFLFLLFEKLAKIKGYI